MVRPWKLQPSMQSDHGAVVVGVKQSCVVSILQHVGVHGANPLNVEQIGRIVTSLCRVWVRGEGVSIPCRPTVARLLFQVCL